MLPMSSLFGGKRASRAVDAVAPPVADVDMLPPSPLCQRAAQLRFAPAGLATSTGEGAVSDAVSSTRLQRHARDGVLSQPSLLLLTQNIGGIDFSEAVTTADAPAGDAVTDSGGGGAMLPCNAANVAGRASSGATSGTAAVSSPRATASSSDDGDVPSVNTAPLTAAQRRVIDEFVADVRAWLHRVAWLHAHIHASSPSSPPLPPSGVTSSTCDAARDDDAESLFASAPPDMARASMAVLCRDGYSAAATPPQLDVFVLHLQEIGGKQRHEALSAYLSSALAQQLLPEAGWTSGLLMDSDDARGCFTALGSIVFLSPRMCAITSMLSFPHRTYLPVVDDPCSYGSSRTHVYHTARFATLARDGDKHTTTATATTTPGARKGFLLLSLRLGTVPLHCCNVHLPHDASNAVAFATSPSVYALRRRACMLETLAECLCVVDKDEPLFVFGDVNVRLDAAAVSRYSAEQWHMTLRPSSSSHKQHHSDHHAADGSGGSNGGSSRRGSHGSSSHGPLRCPAAWWQRLCAHGGAAQHVLRTHFDTELHAMLEAVLQQSGMALAELPVPFAATYSRVPRSVMTADAAAAAAPLRGRDAATTATSSARITDNNNDNNDDDDTAALYASGVMADRMRDFCHTRVPAWCDRVLYNAAALELLAGGCGVPPTTTTAAAQPTRDDAACEATTTAAEEQQRTATAATTMRAARAALLRSVDASMLDSRYVYDAISFVHTDHDGVYLLF